MINPKWILKGDISITDNLAFIQDVLQNNTNPALRIVSMDEENSIPENHPMVVKGTCLLPPIDALIAEADGNEPLYDRIYNDYLNEKFPNVESFSEALELNNQAKKSSKEIVGNLQSGQDEVMMAMDAMQYQDIHRQKIERVINVMRALSRYMSSLFEGKIDDKKRVSSAVHIEGDSTADVVSNDDIEALIASLGQK